MNPLDHFKQFEDYEEYKHLLPKMFFENAEEERKLEDFKKDDDAPPDGDKSRELLAEVEENRIIKEEISISEKTE